MAVQGQTRIPQKHITVLQKKALRIMSFAPFSSHSSFYFLDYNILKFCDISNIEACAFIDNCFNSNTFPCLQKDLHMYQILQDLEENL